MSVLDGEINLDNHGKARRLYPRRSFPNRHNKRVKPRRKRKVAAI